MQVFGYFGMRCHHVARGAQVWRRELEVQLEEAGWAKRQAPFVAALNWHTDRDLWVLDGQREGLIARLEQLAGEHPMRIMGAGAALGAVNNDIRLRRAMVQLGLTPEHLSVPLERDQDIYREAWGAVLDHLIGERAFRHRMLLYDKLCQLTDTASQPGLRGLLHGQSWQSADDLWILGDRSAPWQVDLCSADLSARVLALSDGQHHHMVHLRASGGLSSLLKPHPSRVHTRSYCSLPELLDAVSRHLRSDQRARAGEHLRLPGGAALYRGQPLHSSLLGVGEAPQLNLRLGSLRTHAQQLNLPPVLTAASGVDPAPADAALWSGVQQQAFVRELHVSLTRPSPLPDRDAVALLADARSFILPSGLLRRDLPAVPARRHRRLRGLELYRPANPFRAGG